MKGWEKIDRRKRAGRIAYGYVMISKGNRSIGKYADNVLFKEHVQAYNYTICT
jgi:hypothetical protein